MSMSLGIQKPQGFVPIKQYDAVVVGAGPYGLSAAAHLVGRGLKVAIFGKPIRLWEEYMPKGMLLRSYWWATNLSDPQKQYGMERYFQEHGLEACDPLPRETFIEYGRWFQKQVVPNVDETYVTSIEQQEGRFVVELADGRVVQSPVVVMAPGLRYYFYRPAEYDSMPAELVSHTADHNTFEHFAGKQVVVIGGGQGALESAALVRESGADVQLVTRSPLVWIEGSSVFPEDRPLWQRLRAPKAGISAGWFPWGIEHFPYAFQRLPQATKDRLMRGRGRFGPMGAAWLKPRIEGKVLVHEARVQEMKVVDDGVLVKLSNDKTLKADHVLLGTGYRVDIKKLPMLHPSLISEVQTYQNAPVLNNRFESSVPELYFVGLSSVSSCGPLFRFVVGTEAAARRVAGSAARHVSL